MSILDMPGPEFLKLFDGLVVGAVIVGVGVRMWTRRPWTGAESVGELSAYEVAHLRAGPGGVVDAAIASMAHREIVSPYVAKREAKLRQARALPLDAPEVERHIYHAADRGAAVRRVRQAGWAAAGRVGEKLVGQGLWLSDGRYRAATLGAVLPLIACLALGVTKIAVGVSRGRPVGWLVVLCALTLVAVLWGYRRCNRRTVRGQDVLRALAREHAPLRTTTATAGTAGLGSTDVAMAFALFGGGVALADGRMRETRDALRQGGGDSGATSSSSWSSSSSSCGGGSGGSSSSGDGGGGSSCGGGGGGCGGCGGGGGGD